MKKNTILKYCASLAMGLALSSSLCASYDVTTVAGVAGSFDHTDGVGTAARFKSPGMMSIKLSTGDLLVPGSDNNVRKVTTAGDVYEVSTLFNYNVGWAPVQAVCAYITSAGVPSIITADNYSNLYQWIQSGETYVSNTSLNAVSGPAYDGWGLVVDSGNNIFMTDGESNRIYKILPNGSYSIFAGTGFSAGFADGTGAAARFNGITGITIDSSNNLYASDTGNNTIRKITPAGVVTTIAGTARSSGSTDAAGSSARFNSPWDIDIDAAGNLYIADRGNNSIRKLTLSGATYTASTIAGSAGSPGSTDGTGSAARFNTPTGLAVDASGNIFVTDTGNNTIRRLAYVPPTTITIEVDGTDSATVSAPLAATTVHKTGAGTSVLSGNNSSVSTLSIDAGLVKVAATNNMGASLAFAGGNMEVTSGTVAVPTAAVNAAATITTDSGAAVSSIAAPSGSALLTLAGSGVITAGDMSASATPLSIPGVMHVGASSSSKMPTGVATVPNGGLVKIMGNTASSVPGATQLQSGAVLEVADSIAVPAHTGADIFGTLKFDSGSMLKLGASSTWARNITVGTAL
jgi:sugar lactone lactonase YvrE